MEEFFADFQERFAKIKEHFVEELRSIRTGRASTAMLEGVSVSCYGGHYLLKELVTFQVPEPRLIIVQPFDSSLQGEIEEAIRRSLLGLNPIAEGHLLRIPIPPLTTERREELLKQTGLKLEEARVALRLSRKELWGMIEKEEKEKTLSEDEAQRRKNLLQKNIEEANSQLEKMGENKKKELLSF